MTVHDRDPVLRRKLAARLPAAPEAPPPAGRAPGLARAVGKAISAAAPLVAEQPALHRKKATLAELLDGIDPDAFVTLLGGVEGSPALALMDQEGFTTVIEAMTIGRLGARPPSVRRPTTTDAALLAEVIDASLADLGPEDPLSALRCARPVADHRLLPVILDEVDYDLVALTAVLVSGNVSRPLRLMLALPCLPEPEEETPADAVPAPSWAEALEEAVLRAPSCLRAELGRVTLPLEEVLKLGPGGALTLPLSNLEEVRLVSLDGSVQAIGRLGQSRGMRAVRLTGWPGGMPAPGMIDAAPPGMARAGLGFVPGAQAAAPAAMPWDDAEAPPQAEEADRAAPEPAFEAGEGGGDTDLADFPAMAPLSLSLDDE